jgi:hypothetical protein
VTYFNVTEPVNAIVNIQNYLFATSQVAQTTLRSILGQVELDEILVNRDEINDRLATIIDDLTNPWGVKVTLVEVKDVELPDSMRRAMARQAEAERDRRAKVIHAQGEFEAAQRLSEAAHVMATEHGAMQLRLLQTLADITGGEELDPDLPGPDRAPEVRRRAVPATSPRPRCGRPPARPRARGCGDRPRVRVGSIRSAPARGARG